MKLFKFLLFSIGLVMLSNTAHALPKGFTYVTDARFIYSLNYATNDNIIGRPLNGYHQKKCILTTQAADALIKVQNDLDTLNKGYRILIYDTYRPVDAVKDFKKWSEDLADQKNKQAYYPNLDKATFFDLGYIAEKSSHNRGSTIDLTIMQCDNAQTCKPLDMGTIIDFMDVTANTDNPSISNTAKANRKFLVEIMKKNGFENLPLEWWHFTLNNEPFPDTYFNFPVQ